MQRHNSLSTASSGQFRVEFSIIFVSVYTSSRRSEEALDERVRRPVHEVDHKGRYQDRMQLHVRTARE